MWDDYAETVAEDEEAEYAYALEREREMEEAEDERRRLRDAEFDAALDAYQEREREAADQRAALSDQQALRPDARRVTVTFGHLREGDYMTAEGPGGRWVKVVGIKESHTGGGALAITFETPQPLGVGMHSRWVIDRQPTAEVVIDGSARD